MKWFCKLKNGVRIGIAVAAWLPSLIFTGAIGGSIGENAENLQTWQAIVFMLLLAVGVFFTVFAIKARIPETKAARAEKAKAAAEREKAECDERAAHIVTMSEDAIKSPVVAFTFPRYTKAVGVTFDNCQERIQKSKVGDPLLIKHKPTEEYPESTDIINARTHGRIGRISSDLAWELSGEFDDGFTLDGVIAEITGGDDGKNYGCNIEITGEHYDDD